MHAERVGGGLLNDAGVDPQDVVEIYSELEPCTIPTAPSGCAAYIAKNFPNAKVSYSFEYGATQASRAAGLEELGDALKLLSE
jgi:hypothetical protein